MNLQPMTQQKTLTTNEHILTLLIVWISVLITTITTELQCLLKSQPKKMSGTTTDSIKLSTASTSVTGLKQEQQDTGMNDITTGSTTKTKSSTSTSTKSGNATAAQKKVAGGTKRERRSTATVSSPKSKPSAEPLKSQKNMNTTTSLPLTIHETTMLGTSVSIPMLPKPIPIEGLTIARY